MSFDIIGPGPSRKPVIREAQTMENNGGGGNLGYMQSGRRKKENEEDEFESELQINEDEEQNGDSFNKESDKKDKDKDNEKKSSVLDKLKNFIQEKTNNKN